MPLFSPSAIALIEHVGEIAPVDRIVIIGESGDQGGGNDMAAALARGLVRNPRRPSVTRLPDGAPAAPGAHDLTELWERCGHHPDRPSLAALLAQGTDGRAPPPINITPAPLDGDLERRALNPHHHSALYPLGLTSRFTVQIDSDSTRSALVVLADAGVAGLAALGQLDDAVWVVAAEAAPSPAGWLLRRCLLDDPKWELSPDVAADPQLAVFRRRAVAAPAALPIEFFTIVLNGEPFIRYHETLFADLPAGWRWHFVEGVASLSHDTAWSVAAGGRVLDTVHNRGRSNDGTTEYLDDLAARYPGQVIIHRKPLDQFWDGKREMVNAPLPHITQECLLWQVDADELWTVQQIRTVHAMFKAAPERTAAFYWCDYFVGPDRIISTRYNYAQNPRQEWLRTWRFKPGMRWAAHEPPVLSDDGGRNLGQVHPFTHDEMEDAGVVFQHFAYAIPAQARFKESYYGYADALAHWRRLQAEPAGPVLLKDYLPWVTDQTLVDHAAAHGVIPLAVPADYNTTVPAGAGDDVPWRFRDPAEIAALRKTPAARPRIVVDGVFYQYLNSGIARVWTALLKAWAASGFAQHVLLLDRAGTAPRIPGVHTRTIRAHAKDATGLDSLYLQQVCDEVGAALFVSTYYSTPTTTPSVFFGHDMIPEVMGLDPSDESWKEKARAIQHAAAHIMVSANSARDLARFMPFVSKSQVTVAHNGVDPAFYPADETEIAAFRQAHGLTKPYLLLVGDRVGYRGYKNALLLFRALSLKGSETADLMVVCVGGRPDIEPAFRALAPDTPMARLGLDDAGLRLAYAGATALVYPSRYEGFGMPVAEAMACGCPVITCANSSLTEVGGDAALYVGEDDPAGLLAAIAQARDPAVRPDIIARGLAQAARFTFDRMADTVAACFTDTLAGLADGRLSPPLPVWRELRLIQSNAGHGVEIADTDAPLALRQRLARCEQQARAAEEEVIRMRNSPFWRLRGLTLAILRRLGIRRGHG